MRKSYLSKGLYSILSLFYILTNTNVYAWNKNGHIVISEISYRKLPVELQKKLSDKLNPFFKTHTNDKNNLSIMAQLSYYPDLWHDLTFAEISKKYDLQIPTELSYLKDASTKYWHFDDKYIGPGVEKDICSLPVYKENSVKIIKAFMNSYPQIKDNYFQGLLLIYLIHIIEDMHQPLHGLSYVSEDCFNDYGGNRFCLDQFCNNNLHAYWDSGAHLFYDPSLIPEMVDGLNKRFRFDKTFFELANIDEWNDENMQFSDFIYDVPKDKEPDSDYRHKAQSISKRRILEASERLTKVLTILLRDDSTSAKAQT